MSYFYVNVDMTVDLLIEAARQTPIVHLEDTHFAYSSKLQSISILLLFCTLREILLNQFIEELFIAQAVPDSLRERMLQNNQGQDRLTNKLISSLIGKKWRAAMAEIDEQSGTDYLANESVIKLLIDLRNDFIHTGDQWALNEQNTNDCLDQALRSIHLFVALHNRYVHKP